MKNTMKKVIAIALFVMIFAAFTATVYADDYVEYIEYVDVYDDSFVIYDGDYVYTTPVGGGIIYNNSDGIIEYVDVYDDVIIAGGNYVYSSPSSSGVIYTNDYGKVEYIDIYDDSVIVGNPYYGYNGYYYSTYNNYYNPYAYQNTAPKTYNAVILKNPTGETVKIGGKALFIAGSTNVKEMTWKLVSADGKTTFSLLQGSYGIKEMKDVSADAAKVFKNAKVQCFVDSNGFYNIELSNISKELDGWGLVAEFVGQDGGVVATAAATITVK